MKITVNRNSPSLKKAMNSGMSFKTFRHEHTDYDRVWRAAANQQEYRKLVQEFAEVCVAQVSTLAQKQEIAKWALGKLGVAV